MHIRVRWKVSEIRADHFLHSILLILLVRVGIRCNVRNAYSVLLKTCRIGLGLTESGGGRDLPKAEIEFKPSVKVGSQWAYLEKD